MTTPAPGGARACTTALRDYLADELLADGLIDDAAQVIAGAPRPTTVDRYPAFYVVRRNADIVDRGEGTARASYSVRVYGFARGQTFDEVEAAVDALALRLREAALRSPTAGGRIAGAGIRPTIREDYSDVDTDDVGRSLAGVYVELVVDVDEDTPRRGDLGTVLTYGAAAVPSHPALD